MLCTYSKSEIFDHEILADCPLNLNTVEAKHCPCRKRVWRTGDLRVLECTYPDNWKGEVIRYPEDVKGNIRIRINKLKAERKDLP